MYQAYLSTKSTAKGLYHMLYLLPSLLHLSPPSITDISPPCLPMHHMCHPSSPSCQSPSPMSPMPPCFLASFIQHDPTAQLLLRIMTPSPSQSGFWLVPFPHSSYMSHRHSQCFSHIFRCFATSQTLSLRKLGVCEPGLLDLWATHLLMHGTISPCREAGPDLQNVS